jgi:hypothetical protein
MAIIAFKRSNADSRRTWLACDSCESVFISQAGNATQVRLDAHNKQGWKFMNYVDIKPPGAKHPTAVQWDCCPECDLPAWEDIARTRT